ncbi:reverse transcriptase domain-containing protein [Methylobacillus pratensis]
MATRTGTTATTSCALGPSADWSVAPPADFTFTELVQAYFDCRRNKRNSPTALAFEQALEYNLRQLYDELQEGRYQPGQSICFVITRPKPREVWAADFRDRIVHHLLYNKISGRFHSAFIPDSCACIPGRGTLYGAQRLEAKIRSVTQNWSRPAFYLKMDLANFFVSINKHKVFELLAGKIHEPWWLWLAHTILFYNPRLNVEYRGNPDKVALVPAHKQLALQPNSHGLPIGNLSSQFFANVLLNQLDQYCKHKLQAPHYIRYVDDFILLHESAQWLNGAKEYIEAWLPHTLDLHVNPKKTIIQPIDRGVDFVGQVIKPWRRTTRRRNLKAALARTTASATQYETANSYFGLLGQGSKSHKDRAALARRMMKIGYCVNGKLTKVYRKQIPTDIRTNAQFHVPSGRPQHICGHNVNRGASHNQHHHFSVQKEEGQECIQADFSAAC